MSGEDLTWIPESCPGCGRQLRYLTEQSRVNLSHTHCTCPVGLRNEKWPGHHNAQCRDCNAEMAPPECDQARA